MIRFALAALIGLSPLGPASMVAKDKDAARQATRRVPSYSGILKKETHHVACVPPITTYSLKVLDPDGRMKSYLLNFEGNPKAKETTAKLDGAWVSVTGFMLPHDTLSVVQIVDLKVRILETGNTTFSKSLVGLSREDATGRAKAAGFNQVRIVGIGDKSFPITMDFRPLRINFHLDENGNVESAFVG